MRGISLENGKYTIINHDDINIDVYRNGVFWSSKDLGNDRFTLALIRRLEELQEVNDAKQAHIDELMLEYCPDEMSKEQLDEWAKHQSVSKGDDDID